MSAITSEHVVMVAIAAVATVRNPSNPVLGSECSSVPRYRPRSLRRSAAAVTNRAHRVDRPKSTPSRDTANRDVMKAQSNDQNLWMSLGEAA